jgi:hypothetical protein
LKLRRHRWQAQCCSQQTRTYRRRTRSHAALAQKRQPRPQQQRCTLAAGAARPPRCVLALLLREVPERRHRTL